MKEWRDRNAVLNTGIIRGSSHQRPEHYGGPRSGDAANLWEGVPKPLETHVAPELPR